MTEKLTTEENEQFVAVVLEPIIQAIDLAVAGFDVDRLRETYEAMQGRLSTMQALPFPETMDKAETTAPMNQLYKGVLNLIEIRIKQRDIVIEQANKPDIMQAFGL